MDNHGAIGPHGDGRQLRILGDLAHRRTQIVGLVERFELMNVGKHVIDGLGLDQVQELGAEPVDAKRIRQGEGGGALMLVGIVGRAHKGLLGLHRVPQEPFHIGNCGAANFVFQDIGFGQFMTGAQIGVHGALAVIGDKDHAPGGHRAIDQPGAGVVHALVRHVLGKHVAQPVLGHLAHKCGASAERGDARRGVAGAATGKLQPAGRHLGIEVSGAIAVDQVHDALVHALAGKKLARHRGNDIDDSIADGKNVEAGLGHLYGPAQEKPCRFRASPHPVQPALMAYR